MAAPRERLAGLLGGSKTAGAFSVHTRIDSAEMPVRHQTRRQGRPYTLVLTRTQELLTRDQAVRSQAAADLAWLMSLRTRD